MILNFFGVNAIKHFQTFAMILHFCVKKEGDFNFNLYSTSITLFTLH